jgi:hypothetical protein
MAGFDARLSVSGGDGGTRLRWRQRATGKSFLLLFFKKDVLPCFPTA